MEKVFLCCILLLNGGLVYSQLLSTVNNIRLVNHIPYILELMETAMKDMEEYGWCNLKIPSFEVAVESAQHVLFFHTSLSLVISSLTSFLFMSTFISSIRLFIGKEIIGIFLLGRENVFDWHVKGNVTFQNAFVTSIQKVDVIENTVQQVWRFDNTDNTTSVFAQATLRMVEVALGYDIHMELEDGSHHYFTGIFKHNVAQFPFAVIYNMFTEEFSASVTMTALARSTNKMVFAPATALTQVLSHSYDVTSAAAGMANWCPEVFQPILLNVAKHKVNFPQICYNCAV